MTWKKGERESLRWGMGSQAVVPLLLVWRPALAAVVMALRPRRLRGKKDLDVALLSRLRGALPTPTAGARALLISLLLAGGSAWRAPFHRLLDVILRAGSEKKSNGNNKQQEKPRRGDREAVRALRTELDLTRKQFKWREGLRRALVLLLLQRYGAAGEGAALPDFLIIVGLGSGFRRWLRMKFHARNAEEENHARLERRRRARARREARRDAAEAMTDHEEELSGTTETETETEAEDGERSPTAGQSPSPVASQTAAQTPNLRVPGRSRARSLSRSRARSRERREVRDKTALLNRGGTRETLGLWLRSEMSLLREPYLQWRESSLQRFELGVSVAMASCMMFMYQELPQVCTSPLF
jgi:hypothetical protein